MYKVFLVEDESIVREGLRDNIPWEQFGFAFAGEAGDGEVALPLILQVKPDVLITDIKMPFMDGLTLARMVRARLPETRIIVLSGYQDFEYAREAIEIGVERFLTKPVTRRAVVSLLGELAGKLEEEKQRSSSRNLRAQEMREYEQFRRRRFFESVFAGALSVEQIYQEAGELGLQLTGPCFALMLYDMYTEGTQAAKPSDFDSEAESSLERCREDALAYFLRHTEYLPIPWSGSSVCVLLQGDRESIRSGMERAAEKLRSLTAEYSHQAEYLLCLSGISDRFSALRECYERVSLYYACRYNGLTERVIDENVYQQIASGGARQRDREEEPQTVNVHHVLGRALEYIDIHYTEDNLSLQSVSGYAGVSPAYFSGMFSSRMGMTFIEYVTVKRMEKAKELLGRQGVSTAEAAAECGYRDPNYFRSVFKKTVGCTPREYRSRHEGH